MVRVFLAVLAAASLAGCATMKGDKTVCPEYRGLHCATAPECSMDQARGCRVCQCQAADRSDGRLPTGVPPDLR